MRRPVATVTCLGLAAALLSACGLAEQVGSGVPPECGTYHERILGPEQVVREPADMFDRIDYVFGPLLPEVEKAVVEMIEADSLDLPGAGPSQYGFVGVPHAFSRASTWSEVLITSRPEVVRDLSDGQLRSTYVPGSPTVYVLDPQDGSTRWSFILETAGTSVAMIDEHLVVVNASKPIGQDTHDGAHAIAYDPLDGEIAWCAELGGDGAPVEGSSTLHAHSLVRDTDVSAAGEMLVLRHSAPEEDGENQLLWVHAGDPPDGADDGGRIVAQISVPEPKWLGGQNQRMSAESFGDLALLASPRLTPSGNPETGSTSGVWAYDRTGHRVWEFTNDDPDVDVTTYHVLGADEEAGIAVLYHVGLADLPDRYNRSEFLGSIRSRTLTAVDESGTVLWQQEFAERSRSLWEGPGGQVAEGRVFVTVDAERMLLDVMTGAELTNYPATRHTSALDTTISGGVLYHWMRHQDGSNLVTVDLDTLETTEHTLPYHVFSLAATDSTWLIGWHFGALVRERNA